MRFSTKCWSEHILSAYKATKDLKHPLYMIFKDKSSARVLYARFHYFRIIHQPYPSRY